MYREAESEFKWPKIREEIAMPVWFEFLLALVSGVLLLPLLLLIATPYILIASLLGQGSYSDNAKMRYRGVFEFWKKWGWGFSL